MPLGFTIFTDIFKCDFLLALPSHLPDLLLLLLPFELSLLFVFILFFSLTELTLTSLSSLVILTALLLLLLL